MFYIQHKTTGYYIGEYQDGGVKTVYEKENARVFETQEQAEEWLLQLPKTLRKFFKIV